MTGTDPVDQDRSVPVFQPLLEPEEFEAVQAAMDNGWLGMGTFVGEFERGLKELLATPDRHVAAVSTGHAALHLALLLAGVGRGDEVITPSFNNIADLQAILATGAEVVFCDVDDTTLCLDLEAVDALVGPRTKAVIAMDYGCHLADHDGVEALAARHGLRVIHDAAHSFGSHHRGRPIGSFSDLTMFSFDPVKTITCIDGGALIVRSIDDLTRVREMRLLGMGQPAEVMYQDRRAWTYDVRDVGFRYHLANLHAAIGIQQLRKLERIRANRRRYVETYTDAFADLPDVRTPGPLDPGVTPFLYYVRVPHDARDTFRDHLAQQGVDTGIHWQPGHWFSLFRECRRGDLSVTDQTGGEIVTLPLHSEMAPNILDQVIAAVRSF